MVAVVLGYKLFTLRYIARKIGRSGRKAMIKESKSYP